MTEVMLIQTLKRVKLKGRIGPVIREQYLRDDIPCLSPRCSTCVFDSKAKASHLDQDVAHYAIPCLDVVLNYLEILELPEMRGLIFLQSVVSKILQTHGHRMYNKVRGMCKDIRKGSIVFLNEISQRASVLRKMSDSFEEWLVQCCISAAEYYSIHLKNEIDIYLITEDKELYSARIPQSNVKVCTFKEYLSSKCQEDSSAMQLYESVTLALATASVNDLTKSYDSYLPMDVLEAGIKAGRYVRGHLRVNKHNAQEEAFVTSSKASTKDEGDTFISGMINRNRAVHGDEVVIEVLPRNQWKARSLKLVDNPYDGKDASGANEALSVVLTTGKVVGVLERCWRNYVATLPEEEESNSSVRNKERILVIPYDYRIPKIRIATKQAENIRNQRILVRIDSWEKESQYPNGHFVQTLGEIGQLETEVQSLLIEHGASVGEFPQNLFAELPSCTEKNPWSIEESEFTRRKDLRNTHLIFSIDPKGCEDVDDTLSVRDLPDGLMELGVHIADVTHFVPPLSLVDLEARSRSTSVYLPDRRYDMLPNVLSGNLCSLLGNVDRYAVSVLWKLDSKCQVVDVWYGRTIIKSKYKLCYEAAQDILFGVGSQEMVSEIPELAGLDEGDLDSRFTELKAALIKLYNIANIIRENRLHAGGLELSSVNMKFEIDRNLPSVVTDIKSSKELAVHKTVAECMIFTNHWVAKKINSAFPQQAVLRRHPSPRESDLHNLQELGSWRGFKLRTSNNRELAQSLDEAVDSNDPSINQILRILATQTMNQATYCCVGNFSATDLYHYGLGLDEYTHFTSPIRRYADILVHRLLLKAVEESKMDDGFDAAEMEEICHHMNLKHKAAQDLEKDAQQLFLTFFFEEQLSKDNSTPLLVDAVIYALRTNGMLVFVPKYGIKGSVCLCNKEQKVAIVNESVEWSDGKLTHKGNTLVVEARVQQQTYKIFDHVTVSIKIQKSRSHQQKILLDLVDNKPYMSDWTLAEKELPKLIPTKSCVERTEVEEKFSEDASKSSTTEEKDFNLYVFLQYIKQMTLIDKSSS